MAIELGAAYISILPETSKLTGGIKSALKDADREADRAGRSMGSKLSGGIKTAMKGVALGGAGLLGGIAGIGIKTAAEFEQIQISMETLMGSSAKARKEMAWLTKKAAATPFELSDLAQADKTLLGFGFTSDKVRRQFLMDMGNMAAAVGLPSERVPDLAKVFGQIQASGRASMEDVNQLIDAGIPVWDALGKKTGMTVAEMRDAMSKGQISSQDFISAMQEMSQTKFGDAMEKQSQTLAGLWSTLKDNLAIGAMNMIKPFVPMIKDLMPKFADLMAVVGQKVAVFARWVNGDLVPAISEAAGWLKDNKDYFIALGAALGTAGIALVAYNTYVKVSTAITKAWAIAQAILNGTMRANPIGIVITALALLVGGLVLAYKKSDTFRKIVQKAWAGIKKAVQVAWDGYIKPALKALWQFITKSLMPTIKSLWSNVIRPVFGFIGKAIAFTWNNVVKPIFKAWWFYVSKVLFPIIKALWNNVIKPVFTGIGKTIKTVWDRVIKPVFESLRGFIQDKVVPGFRKGVDAIKAIWEGLKAAARKPVEFLVNTVYMQGIRAMMNKIPGVNLPAAHFAGGGVLPGWSPGRDIHSFYSPTGGFLNLSGGEAIMRPEFTRAVGGKKGVARLNRLARAGMAFASGGVWPASGTSSRHSGYPWARWAGDINIPGDADLGNPVRAYKDGVVAATNYWTSSYGNHVRVNHPGSNERTLYAHLSKILVGPGQVVKAGQIIGRVGSTGNSSGPHLHFEIAGGSDPINARSGGLSPREEAENSWMSVITGIPDLAKKVWSSISGMATTGWAGEFRKAATAMLKNAVGWIDNKIPDRWLPDNPVRSALSALGIFDNGGVLEPGAIAFNASRKPEAVFNHKQFKSFAQTAVNAGTARRVEMTITNWNTGEGYFREVARDEIDGEFQYSNMRRRMG